MFPLPYEKAILRRVIPTWEEIVCSYVSSGILSRSELKLAKCIRRVPKSSERRLGVQNALLIVSPGLDCNRLLFYLLLYLVNPLHVYDGGTSEYRVVFQDNLPQLRPSLAIQNLEMVLRSDYAYSSIFDLSSLEYVDAEETNQSLFPHLFNDIKLRSAIEMRRRLIFVLGIDLDESAVMATQFAYMIKRMCQPSESSSDSLCIQVPFPKFLDGTVLAHEREKMYIQGGIYFVSSRIVLVDLLTSKVVPELISGVIIVNAHRITKDYNIPLFIKLLRSRASMAFIKAITDNVSSMKCRENLNFLLKSLFTKDCFIFPRCSGVFDAVLNNDRVQPETFEVGFQLSDSAKQIHSTIVQVLHRLVSELQRNNSKELQQLDMNTVIYSTNVKRLLETILQKVSTTTSEYHIRRVMRSITNLHMMLNQLLGMNSLSFLAFAEQMKSAEMESDWLWTPYGNTIYRVATERVYEPNPEEESGLVLKIETDKKTEYIKRLLSSDSVDGEELADMLRNAMKWHGCRRPWKGPSRYKTTPSRSNLSCHVTRRRLCAREARHTRRICRFFECNGVLTRRALVVVDSGYLQSSLSSSLTIPIEKYNQASFMFYASRRADAYEFGPPDEEKFTGYAQTHFYRSLIRSRQETDKLLHRFVVWTKYNDIYSRNNRDDKLEQESPSSRTTTIGLTKDLEVDIGNAITASDDKEKFFKESDMGNEHDSSGSNGEDESEKGTPLKRRKIIVSPQSNKSDSSFAITMPINDKLKCKVKVVNVSYTQPRNEVLKGIMGRKLNADDSTEPIPLTCSPYEFCHMLHRAKPSVIVVYRPNIKVFRIIEQYCAQRFFEGKRKYVKVYVLSYMDCLESHRFAREIKNELECWQQIQQHIKSLPLTFDEGVLLSNNFGEADTQALAHIPSPSQPSLEMPMSAITEEKGHASSSLDAVSQGTPRNVSSSVEATAIAVSAPAGPVAVVDTVINNFKPTAMVLVDTREFRCQLPYHLYCRNIQLVPLVLEMGDYLITRDMCVERKSLYDLISSLSSGRLAQQAEELCSVYAFPFLLVEFDDAEAFHLSPCQEDNSFGFNYIYSKLCILCCNYPKLRIIWSQSPKMSARVLAMLKTGRSEPDVATNNVLISQARGALKISDDNREAITVRRRPEDVTNRDALRILRKIPGVTSYNIVEILSRVNSLRELSEMTEEELLAFLPEANASAIFKFFNQSLRGFEAMVVIE